jgi:oleandomycin transport system ATP-binding protein
MNPVIQVDGLGKNFGATRALGSVDLAVRRGTVLGLLGPNGSGKTTTVCALATLLRPDSGGHACSATVVAEPEAVRARIGLTGRYAADDEACPVALTVGGREP